MRTGLKSPRGEYLEDVYALASVYPWQARTQSMLKPAYRYSVGFGASLLQKQRPSYPLHNYWNLRTNYLCFRTGLFVIADHVTSIHPSEYIDPSGLIGRGPRRLMFRDRRKSGCCLCIHLRSTGVPILTKIAGITGQERSYCTKGPRNQSRHIRRWDHAK